MPPRLTTLIGSALLLTAVVALPAMASNPHPRARALVAFHPQPWAPARTAAGSAGMRVAIDPETGMLGMVAPSSTEFVPYGADPEPVRIDHYPNGMITATLDDRFAEFAVATLGPDGKPAWQCAHGRDGAKQALAKPAAKIPAGMQLVKWEDR